MDGKCFVCKEDFEMGKNVFTEAGRRETLISGFCESCFDRICSEPEEELEDED